MTLRKFNIVTIAMKIMGEKKNSWLAAIGDGLYLDKLQNAANKHH
jgi:hypothetical protein